MAADVSSWAARLLNGRSEEQPQVHTAKSPTSDILITKDLLGGLSKVTNKELDLQFKTGKAYGQRQSSPNSALSSSSSSLQKDQQQESSSSDSKLQDLNYPPVTAQPINFLLEENCLDLKLQSSSATAASSHYQSVCTLDKVKCALERAEKENIVKKRSSSPSTAGMFAAACPGCLLYVIALKTNPRCPGCNSVIPSALAAKKPKIDLNQSF